MGSRKMARSKGKEQRKKAKENMGEKESKEKKLK